MTASVDVLEKINNFSTAIVQEISSSNILLRHSIFCLDSSLSNRIVCNQFDTSVYSTRQLFFNSQAIVSWWRIEKRNAPFSKDIGACVYIRTTQHRWWCFHSLFIKSERVPIEMHQSSHHPTAKWGWRLKIREKSAIWFRRKMKTDFFAVSLSTSIHCAPHFSFHCEISFEWKPFQHKPFNIIITKRSSHHSSLSIEVIFLLVD